MSPQDMTLKLLLALLSIQTVFSELCSSTDDCNYTISYCSTFDYVCYDVFDFEDIDSYSIYQVSNGDVTNDYDLSDVMDSNGSSEIVLTTSRYTGPVNNSYTFTIQFPAFYWIHYISVNVSDPLGAVQFKTENGILESSFADSGDGWYLFAAETYEFPQSTDFVEIFTDATKNVGDTGNLYTLFAINIYGAYGTPSPTSEPTNSPTDETIAPSTDPTPAPSAAPSLAPTGYPTPDICEDFYISQSCCGGYGYQIENDQVNLVNSSVNGDCYYTFNGSCCEEEGPGSISADRDGVTSNDWTYGCGSSAPKSENKDVCNITYFNDSTLDVGYVVDSELAFFPINDTDYSLAELGYDENCRCLYTAYMCNGTDSAICGSSDDFDDFFEEPCFVNFTNKTFDELDGTDEWKSEACTNISIFDDADYSFLLWDSCGDDSFIGDVSHIVNSSSENVHDGSCKCTYRVHECQMVNSGDCYHDDCCDEYVEPCCGLEDGEYKGVLSASEFDDYGFPMNWTCKADMDNMICPDRWNGSYYYTAEKQVHWWLDLYGSGDDNITNTCNCRYTLDTCNLPPTPDPSPEPTESPTTATPTKAPTKTPTKSGDTGDNAHRIMLTVSSIISTFVVFIALFC